MDILEDCEMNFAILRRFEIYILRKYIGGFTKYGVKSRRYDAKNVIDKIRPCREKQASEKDTILLVKI